MIQIEKQDQTAIPLQELQVRSEQPCHWRAYDGGGREYARGQGTEFRFTVSGELGHHVVAACDEDGREQDRASFRVDCSSDIEDASGRYKRLLHRCKLKTMRDIQSGGNVHGLDGTIQRGFVVTSRDHVHGHKAMRYFYPWNREWIHAFCDHQPESGMVWDFLSHRKDGEPKHFELRWGEEFYKVVADGDAVFARQPVMNDLEHMLIRGIWQTWRTTGDDEWMAGRLDNALKALEYATTSPYTWSEKFGLVHRPCCIDMWDFQSEFDAEVVDGDSMMAIPGVSQYGAMHGDSMGLAQACDELAQMLEHVGRVDEADEVRETGRGLRENLDRHCWNGEFFTHFVPENDSFERPFGVDQDQQVSLSNAYALNRGLAHDQCVAIIETYQRLREETKETSPAEWFCMYPPFPRGFGAHKMWHYVNGGVSPMVAGELAHGAFEHGYEAYATDIIDRVAELTEAHGTIPRVWRGRIPREPERKFHSLDLREAANTDLRGTDEPAETIPWTMEGDNDLHEMPTGRRKFESIEFDVIDPEENRGRACVGLSADEPYAPELELKVGAKAQSLYFLHTVAGGSGPAGDLSIHYADGTAHRQYVKKGRHISGWWMPHGDSDETRFDPTLKVAWRGENAHCADIGVMVWGLDNPHPDREIERLVLRPALDGALWLVLGITLSDAPVWLQPSILSRGIPSPWSVGAVVWAMFEGLAGVYDTEPNFAAARIAPRWAAGATSEVTVTAKYEEGGGYVRYAYEHTDDALRLQVAASGTDRRFELLLPEGFHPGDLTVDGQDTDYEVREIECSRYACFDVAGVGSNRIALHSS